MNRIMQVYELLFLHSSLQTTIRAYANLLFWLAKEKQNENNNKEIKEIELKPKIVIIEAQINHLQEYYISMSNQCLFVF